MTLVISDTVYHDKTTIFSQYWFNVTQTSLQTCTYFCWREMLVLNHRQVMHISEDVKTTNVKMQSDFAQNCMLNFHYCGLILQPPYLFLSIKTAVTPYISWWGLESMRQVLTPATFKLPQLRRLRYSPAGNNEDTMWEMNHNQDGTMMTHFERQWCELYKLQIACSQYPLTITYIITYLNLEHFNWGKIENRRQNFNCLLQLKSHFI